jgi:AcrR family transcriptional regulator
MTPRTSTLSTADARRPVVASAAVRAFARGGYHGTTIAAVGAEAGISTAYVFKLFPGKEQLFVAALDYCFEQIEAAISAGADAGADASPAGILDAMGAAYAQLISDRTLLLLQVHAQSVADVPEIGAALRRGLERITRFAQSRSGAADADVQRFIAFGQLCHLIVTAGIADLDEGWAGILNAGIRHPRG